VGSYISAYANPLNIYIPIIDYIGIYLYMYIRYVNMYTVDVQVIQQQLHVQ
jgi:hypothetical protein